MSFSFYIYADKKAVFAYRIKGGKEIKVFLAILLPKC